MQSWAGGLLGAASAVRLGEEVATMNILDKLSAAMVAAILSLTLAGCDTLFGPDDRLDQLRWEAEAELRLSFDDRLLYDVTVRGIHTGDDTFTLLHGACEVRLKALYVPTGEVTREPEENPCIGIGYEARLEPGDTLVLQGAIPYGAVGPYTGTYELTAHMHLGDYPNPRVFVVPAGTIQIGFHPAGLSRDAHLFGALLRPHVRSRGDSVAVVLGFYYPRDALKREARLMSVRPFGVRVYGSPDVDHPAAIAEPRATWDPQGAWETRRLEKTDSITVTIPAQDLPAEAEGGHWFEVALPMEDGSLRKLFAGKLDF